MDHKARRSRPTSLDPRFGNVGTKRSEAHGSGSDVRRRGSVESATGSSDNCSMSSPSPEFAVDTSRTVTSPGGSLQFPPQACSLCDDGPPYTTELAFSLHLTITHFRKDILDQIKSPDHCPKCDYKPQYVLSREQRMENMLMHVGCEDRVAILMYKKAVSNLSQPSSSRRQEVKPDKSVICELCSKTFPMERLFIRHLTLVHFSRELGARLPRRAPFKCPVKNCSVKKPEERDLLLHYGCEHSSSLTLYKFKLEQQQQQQQQPAKDLKPVTPPDDDQKPTYPSDRHNYLAKDPPPGKICLPKPVRITKEKPHTCCLCPDETRTTFDSNDAYKWHLFREHFFRVLPKPLKCPDCGSSFLVENGFFNHFMEIHLSDRMKEETRNRERRKLLAAAKYEPQSGERTLRDQSLKPHPSSSVTSSSVTSSRLDTSDVTSVRTTRETSSNPVAMVPRSRVTVHSRKDADSSSSSSSDRYRAMIDHLKRKLQSQEKCHREAIKKKDQDFERWITSKEKALEDEAKCRRSAEKNFEDVQVNLLDRDNEVKTQKLQLGKAKEHMARSRKENSQLRKEKEKIEQELSECQVEVHCLREENKNLEDKLTESAKETEKLEQRLKSEKKVILNQKTESEKQLKLIKQLTAEKQTFKEQISGFEKSSRQHKTSEEKLQEEVRQLRNQLDVVLKIKLEASVDQSANEKELNELRVKFESSEQILNDKDRRIEALLKVNGDNVAEHKTELERMKGEVKKAEDKVEAIEVDLHNAREQNRILLSENEGLSRSNKDLQNVVNSWQKKHDLKVNDIMVLQMKNDNLASKIQELSAKLLQQGTSESLTRKVENLKTKVGELGDQLIDAQNNEARAEARLQRRNDELKALLIVNSDHEEKIRDLEKDIRQKSSRNDQLEADMVKLVENDNAKKAHIQTSMQELHRKVTQLTGQVKTLERENAALQAKWGETAVRPVTSRPTPSGPILSGSTSSGGGAQLQNPPESRLSSSLTKQTSASVPSPATNSVQPSSEQPPIPVPHIKVKPKPASKQRKANLNCPQTSSEPTVSPGEALIVPQIPPHQQHHPEQSQVAEQVPLPGLSSSSTQIQQVQPKQSPTKPKRPCKRKTPKKPKAVAAKKARPDDVIFDEDVNQKCGICFNYDPPILSGTVTDGSSTYYTEWIGCDCDNWYHKICTGLEKNELEQFVCAKLSLECQQQPMPPE